MIREFVLLRIQSAIIVTRVDSNQIKRQVIGVLVSEDSLGVIQSETDSLNSMDAPWTANLELNGRILNLRLTLHGADVTVIMNHDSGS